MDETDKITLEEIEDDASNNPSVGHLPSHGGNQGVIPHVNVRNPPTRRRRRTVGMIRPPAPLNAMQINWIGRPDGNNNIEVEVRWLTDRDHVRRNRRETIIRVLQHITAFLVFGTSLVVAIAVPNIGIKVGLVIIGFTILLMALFRIFR